MEFLKLLKPVLFPIADKFDVGNQILSNVIVSKFAKGKLTNILVSLLVIVFRAHIASILGYILSFNTYVDFVIQIFLSVVLVLYTSVFHHFINLFYPKLYLVVRYCINNYTPERYRKWKIIIVTSICIYLMLILQFIEINSRLLTIYIIQYLVAYFTVDIIEQQKLQTLLKMYNNKPRRKVYGELNIIDNYVLENSYMNSTITSSSEYKPIKRRNTISGITRPKTPENVSDNNSDNSSNESSKEQIGCMVFEEYGE